MRFVLLLSFFIIIVDCQELRHTCSKGDTEWNRVLVGAHLRHWLSSIQLTGNKSPTDYLVVFKPRVKTPKDVEEHTRLDFVVKLNSIGNSIGKAWKNFGYKGPKYHDGFLYGKLDANNQMTGNSMLRQQVSKIIFHLVMHGLYSSREISFLFRKETWQQYG